MTHSIAARSLAALTLFALCACGTTTDDEADAGSPVDAHELAARIAAGDAPLILDVRTPAEFDAGHLPGAHNIPHDALADRLDELAVEKDAEIVVHCHSGRRAVAAEETLREAGYTNVRDLTGHWQAWSQAGHPTEP